MGKLRAYNANIHGACLLALAGDLASWEYRSAYAGVPVAGPVVRRTAPCWCGAERPYFSRSVVRTCGGTGELRCRCGGDNCACHNHGSIECWGCDDCSYDDAADFDDYDYDDWDDPAELGVANGQV